MLERDGRARLSAVALPASASAVCTRLLLPAPLPAPLQPRLAVLHRCSYTVTIRQLVGSILRIANSDPHFRGELRIVIRKYAANCEYRFAIREFFNKIKGFASGWGVIP